MESEHQNYQQNHNLQISVSDNNPSHNNSSNDPNPTPNNHTMSNNRVKKNWSKVRQLLMINKNKDNSKHKDQHKEVDQTDKISNKQRQLKNRKNNLYSLFDQKLMTQNKENKEKQFLETKYCIKLFNFNQGQNYQKFIKTQGNQKQQAKQTSQCPCSQDVNQQASSKKQGQNEWYQQQQSINKSGNCILKNKNSSSTTQFISPSITQYIAQSVAQSITQSIVQSSSSSVSSSITSELKIQIRTHTPLPTINKIISATTAFKSSQQANQSNQQLVEQKAQIDTTGFWIWQAEQILSYFLIKIYEQNQLRIKQNKSSLKSQSSFNVIDKNHQSQSNQSSQQQNQFIQKSTSISHSLDIISSNQFYIDFSQINTVLQLGAGSSGLASLIVAKLIEIHASFSSQSPLNSSQQSSKSKLNDANSKTSQIVFSMQQIEKQILITDGKIQNITYLKQNIQLYQIQSKFSQISLIQRQLSPLKQKEKASKQIKNNSGQQLLKNVYFHFPKINIQSKFMLWGTQINKKYDLILSADSLFFQQFHHELILTLHYSMSQNSTALFVNPKRGRSMENFIQLAKLEGFQAQFIDFKDQKFKKEQNRVRQSIQFDEDRHIFYFIKLKKAKAKGQSK